MGRSIGPVKAYTSLIVRFTFPLNVAADEYTLTAGFGNGGFSEGSFQRVLGLLHEVAMLTVLPNRRAIQWSGLINLRPQVEFEMIGAGADEAAGVR